MTDYCDDCGRRADYTIREADTGTEYAACTPQGCNVPPPDSPELVECINCDGEGITSTGWRQIECPVCNGAGHTTAARHNAWLASGVLIDPDCWWQRVGNISALHGPDGFIGQVVHMRPDLYWAKFRTGTTTSFDTAEDAEKFLYILMDDNSGAAK